MDASGRLLTLACAVAIGCGPERLANDGLDGREHWLLYTVSTDDPEPTVTLRAVDLGQLEQGQIGEPIDLLESTTYEAGQATSWGAWMFELDGVSMLLDLDAAGVPTIHPLVPEHLPAGIRYPKFSADGRVALFSGESSSPPDAYYWVRYEHAQPIAGGPIAQMPAQLSFAYWISPDGSYGVIDHRADGQTESRLYRFELDPEPGELVPLFVDDSLYVAELFDEHLFAWAISEMLHVGDQLMLVDMSSGEAGEIYPVSPGQLGGQSVVWFSPTGDMVVWLDIPFNYSMDDTGTLWRVDVVDGIPLPAVQLTDDTNQVDRARVLRPGHGLLAWQPGEDVGTPLSWVDFVDGQLQPIHTIDEGAFMRHVNWSPDGRYVTWTGTDELPDAQWRSVAALEGPERGVPKQLVQPDQLAMSSTGVWIGDRLLHGNADKTALWSVTLDDAGPSSSRPLHAAPELGPVHTVDASSRVLGHDAAVLRVVPEADARAHLQLLRFGADEQLEALRVDDDPRSQSFVHQLVRE